jgi:hypothetical protein
MSFQSTDSLKTFVRSAAGRSRPWLLPHLDLQHQAGPGARTWIVTLMESYGPPRAQLPAATYVVPPPRR